MTMQRRELLALAALLPVAACTTATAPPSATTSDVLLIAQAFEAAITPMLDTLGVSPEVASQITAWIADLQQIAATALTAALAQQVAQDVNNVSSGLSSTSGLTADIEAVLSAAETLLPVILAVFGVAAVRPRRATMSPEQARSILWAHARH